MQNAMVILGIKTSGPVIAFIDIPVASKLSNFELYSCITCCQAGTGYCALPILSIHMGRVANFYWQEVSRGTLNVFLEMTKLFPQSEFLIIFRKNLNRFLGHTCATVQSALHRHNWKNGIAVLPHGYRQQAWPPYHRRRKPTLAG